MHSLILGQIGKDSSDARAPWESQSTLQQHCGLRPALRIPAASGAVEGLEVWVDKSHGAALALHRLLASS
ncbi:hypothetical protein NDU88_006263 [Pleurodeles waltl]|uniref:Uncharacterized protein n=1 Tax=Pleurodeles waltl TaxID=8319 RepID=A0AAV7MBQ7_PLEWA|nr:hypothetical protein NDU88_006263 [Pleurodeles waltl]